jgi:hypothetical protein
MSSPFDVILVDAPCTRDREREIGFSTANSFAIRGEALKVGLETSYQNVSHPGARNEAKNLFELGPSCTIKPSLTPVLTWRPCLGSRAIRHTGIMSSLSSLLPDSAKL